MDARVFERGVVLFAGRRPAEAGEVPRSLQSFQAAQFVGRSKNTKSYPVLCGFRGAGQPRASWMWNSTRTFIVRVSLGLGIGTWATRPDRSTAYGSFGLSRRLFSWRKRLIKQISFKDTCMVTTLYCSGCCTISIHAGCFVARIVGLLEAHGTVGS